MKTAKVLWGATDFGAPQFSGDILWKTGFRAPDPFFIADIEGEVYIFVSALEYDRAKKETESGEVLLAERGLGSLADFLKKNRVRQIEIPAAFPHGQALALKKEFRVAVKEAPMYPERLRKTKWEIEEIVKSQRALERALRRAFDFLRACGIRGDIVIDGTRAVTSELLRAMIDNDLFREGFLGVNTIVSSGFQAADPHATGSGPLEAHKPIVIDIFPVSLATHYYADMTRTVFKGEPSEEYARMYETVRAAQSQAIAAIRAGADGKEICDGARRYFEEAGYPTRIGGKKSEGFIHGLGHGVGIDIHEPPSLGARRVLLEAGNMVTVEPGLYYPRASRLIGTRGAHGGRNTIPAGGIRIEDMVLVTRRACKNFTRFKKNLASVIL